MKINLTPGRLTLGRFALSGALLAPAFAFATPAYAAAGDVAPNTVISNTATATYSDSSATPNNYSTTSNTVTTTVQNAPSVTITGTAAKNVAPGQTATDFYTITNTGNGPGTVTLTAANGGTDAPAVANASLTYTFNGTTYTTLAALDTAIGALGVGASATFGIVYTVPTTAGTTAPGNTYTTTPTATITQASGGAAGSTTSAGVSATDTDNVTPDARLDLQKNVVSSSATAISYTIAAGDGSANFSAKDLTSAQALVGATAPGVLITDKIPQYPAGTPFAVSAIGTPTTSAAAGFLGGAISVYTTTNPNGTAGWTKLTGAFPQAAPAGTTYVGVYVSGGTGGFEFGPDGTTALSTPGAVTAAETALSLPLTLAVPNTPGVANQPVLNLANSIIGSNQATETILGPGIPAGTTDVTGGAPNTAPLTTAGQGINNTTGSTPTAPVNEASNQTSTAIPATASVSNGPASVLAGTTVTTNNSGATGSYDGVVPVSGNNDFTNGVLVAGAGNNVSTNGAAATATVPAGSPLGTASTASVTNSLYNSGTANEAYNLSFTLPAGVSIASITRSDGVVVTQTSGGTSATEVFNFGSVPSGTGSVVNYTVNYAAPATLPTLTREDVAIVATGATSGDTNTTHNELYAGFIAIFKTQTVTSTGCPTGTTQNGAASTGTVCPGGVIQYGVNYRDIATPQNGTEPATAVATTTATKFVVTENGTLAPNNWATNSNGLDAAPTDTTAGTTFTFTGGTAGVGATAFVATVGGATGTLASGAAGTITFSVTVK